MRRVFKVYDSIMIIVNNRMKVMTLIENKLILITNYGTEHHLAACTHRSANQPLKHTNINLKPIVYPVKPH